MISYQQLGQVALGSALRQLADQVTKDAEKIYCHFGFDIDPTWFPVFYVLASKEAESVVGIAKIINHSHVSVSKIVKQMKAAGLVDSRKSDRDSRVTLISLSATAQKMIPNMLRQCEAVHQSTSQLFKDTGIDLFAAIKVSERHLRHNTLSDRIKQGDASTDVRLVDYAPQYQAAYKQLNVHWISQHWPLEEPDYQSLDHPEAYILDKGGVILIALSNDEVVGCCGLIKMNEATYELVKMAVSPSAQGKGVGFLLGQAVLERAFILGAKRVYLESNSVLKPALNLYLKLGFEHIEDTPSPYDRCNVHMEKILK